MTQARDNSLHVFGECKQEGEGAEEVKEGKIVAGRRGGGGFVGAGKGEPPCYPKLAGPQGCPPLPSLGPE